MTVLLLITGLLCARVQPCMRGQATLLSNVRSALEGACKQVKQLLVLACLLCMLGAVDFHSTAPWWRGAHSKYEYSICFIVFVMCVSCNSLPPFVDVLDIMGDWSRVRRVLLGFDYDELFQR
jgi:hypothetical protein